MSDMNMVPQYLDALVLAAAELDSTFHLAYLDDSLAHHISNHVILVNRICF